MMKKMMILGAGAAGYVLGARAGRERYEQIAQQAQKLRTNPTVRQKVAEATHVAKDAAGTASEKIRSRDGMGSPSASTVTSPSTPGTAADGFGRGDDGI